MSKLWLFTIGLLMGVALVATWRFTHYRDERVHYHANFAVYVNGVRETFSAPTYYEETAGCAVDEATTPIERVHMHGNQSDLVHVHAAAVTWGQFFENLGWGIGPGYLRTRTRLLVADAKHPLTYLLNGQTVENPATHVLGNEDRLLVSYGTADSSEVEAQFASVANSAKAKNAEQDPAGCGGSAKPSWRERWQHVIQ